jgi:hypothetical protein
MRGNPSWWLLCLGLCCTSCETVPQQKVAVPPTPPPVAKPAPIVVVQTVAQLPDPQPVPPAAIPPRHPIEYQPPVKEIAPEPEPTHDPKTPKAAPRNSSRIVRRPAGEAPVTETAPPATPVVEEPVAPPKLSAADEAFISRDQLNVTLTEVQRLLKQLSTRPQTASSKATITRIHSFVRLAEQSAARNDLRQGDILAHRALTLARDLARPK